jgi:exportin-2 (importin alpha re-exporter)
MTEIVCQISRVDFPENWPRLIQVLAENLQKATDFDQLVVTLGTLEQLVNRYRHEMRSNRLWTEILLVVQNVNILIIILFNKGIFKVAEPLTQLYSRMLQYLPDQQANAQLSYTDRLSWLKIVLELTRIYHSLVSQDLPEYFEVIDLFITNYIGIFIGQSNSLDGRVFTHA